MSFSKSEEKSLGCQRYYAGSYLSRDPAMLLMRSSPLAETGTDIHRYRSQYIQHLTRTLSRHDKPWALRWLETAQVTDEARDLITSDIARFMIDPELVFSTEIFLSTDEHFSPARRVLNAGPGVVQKSDSEFIDGTIDLLSIDGDQAMIDDYKSGWSNANVTEYEAAHYSALVFSHFPYIQGIRFAWEFLRAKAKSPVNYTREDLAWMHAAIRSAAETKRSIREAYERGEELPVNPTAGLCGFCELTCPLKSAVTRNVLEIPPLQTEDDARTLAQRVLVATIYSQNGRERIKQYLAEKGRLELGGGWIAEMSAESTQEFPLDKVIDLLGLAIAGGRPDVSPQWDIPLSSLKVSSTRLKSFAKAQKRAGMQDALAEISRDKPRFELKIHKVDVQSNIPANLDLLTGATCAD